MKSANTVDAYIANAPKEIQSGLKELREAITSTVPDAQERISYGMPYYDYKGRLVYFGFFKDHVSVFIPGAILKEHTSELEEYKTATATIRFPHDKDLPIALIKKLVIARAKEIQEALKKH